MLYVTPGANSMRPIRYLLCLLRTNEAWPDLLVYCPFMVAGPYITTQAFNIKCRCSLHVPIT